MPPRGERQEPHGSGAENRAAGWNGTRKKDVMIAIDGTDSAVIRRIARRVEDILEAARERECKGQVLALDIDARFRLEDTGAVQFQVASAILEETSGLGQEEVVGELLTLGLAAVLSGAARAAGAGGGKVGDALAGSEDEFALDEWPVPGRDTTAERVLN